MKKPKLKRLKRLRTKKFKSTKAITAKFYSGIRKANKKRAPSSLELLVYSWLDEEGIEYKKEKAIGRCHVDIFLEPDICIELQGCYWHACDKCYLEPTKSQLAARLKDAKRFLFLEKKGYKVVSIRECDVKNIPNKIKKQLRKLANVPKQSE